MSATSNGDNVSFLLPLLISILAYSPPLTFLGWRRLRRKMTLMFKIKFLIQDLTPSLHSSSSTSLSSFSLYSSSSSSFSSFSYHKQA